jgi:uncharacterized protein
MAVPFLTARWANLCLVNYAVPPALLQQRVPPGLALEQREGRAFVSLVGFQFLDTRVLGIPWPGYRDFAELNLRFYVRNGAERGVVFLREFVPKRLVAWLARALYNEPYQTAPLEGIVASAADRLNVEYRLQWGGDTHHVRVAAEPLAMEAPESSDEHFFTEQRWGFGVDRRGRTLRYRVEHPVWKSHAVRDFEVAFDYGAVYGVEWRFLANEKPFSVVLAAGSAVTVYSHSHLAGDGNAV